MCTRLLCTRKTGGPRKRDRLTASQTAERACIRSSREYGVHGSGGRNAGVATLVSKKGDHQLRFPRLESASAWVLLRHHEHPDCATEMACQENLMSSVSVFRCLICRDAKEPGQIPPPAKKMYV